MQAAVKNTHRNSSGASSLPRALLALLLCITLIPIAALVIISFRGNATVWAHLLQYVLPGAAWQTAILLLLVALGTGIIGTGTAWLTTLCAFPGRKYFAWALMLPLAVPTYIAAYAHVEIFDYSGPLQSAVRAIGGFSTSRDYWFPDIRSLWGAGLVFSSVLYPYVFLTSRLTFSMQGSSALDVSRSLGSRPLRMFRKVGLPMARPAIAAGVALALMESMNDIGAVEYLGVKTLTLAVFDTWLNRDSLAGAAQLSLIVLIIVLLLIWIERRSQGKRSYSASAREKPPALLELTRRQQWLAIVACALPIIAGLGVPLFVLGGYALKRLDQISDPALLDAALNSALVALCAGLLAVLISYTVLLTNRITGNATIGRVGRLASLGYAVPGTVLGIGLLIPLAAFDNAVDLTSRSVFGVSTGLLISGSIFIIVYACTLRFLAVAWGTLETGFSRMSPHVDMAARALGRRSLQLAWEVHTPIMRNAIGAAFLLVFVESMKELSATLLLRPFNFQTLATLVYDKASQSSVEDAAVAALTIIVIGLVPVVFLTRFSLGPRNS